MGVCQRRAAAEESSLQRGRCDQSPAVGHIHDNRFEWKARERGHSGGGHPRRAQVLPRMAMAPRGRRQSALELTLRSIDVPPARVRHGRPLRFG